MITWRDSDDEAEDRPTTSNLAAVSEKTKSLVKEACTKRLINSARLQTRNVFPLPQVAATRTPQLDSFIKLEVPQLVKTSDKEWARLQTFVLDALAPLTSLLEADAKGETISHDQALEATKAATQLIGNASAQISHTRRSKVLTHLNKSLLPLLEEDTNFEDVAPSLFRPEFVRKSKDLMDQVRAIRSTTQKDPRLFFRQVPPRGEVTVNAQGEVETKAPGRGTGSSNRARGLNEPNSNELLSRVCKSLDKKLQKYSRASDIMHGGKQSVLDRSPSSRETLPSPVQLVGNHSGPLGIEHSTGLPDRLCVEATPTVSSQPSTLLLRTNQSDSRGVNKTAQEAGDLTVGTSCEGRIPVQHFPSPQEGRRAETSDKPQSPQPARKCRAFQNGGYSHGERPVETGGLACQSGFEGCLLHHPRTSVSQEMAQVSSPQKNLSLHVSTFRTVISPVGIHQDSEANLSPPSRNGNASGSIYG